ncbi:MAG: sigma 54-interacting transcriptional regulator [Deltaproteobacteria bacterium]|nr:sigma 54-interacting transcriptional regulator [Deltaproteobacteria bacterium]
MENAMAPDPQPDEGTLQRLSEKVARLEEQNRDLMGMIENSYDALAIIDGEGRLILLNPAVERTMGLKNSEILGRKVADLIKEGIIDNATSVKILETPIAQTVLINTIAGKQVLSTGTPVFDAEGRVHRIYVNLRDVTGLNDLKEKFEQSQTLLSKYLLELNEVKQYQMRRKDFVAHNPRMRQVVETAYRMGRVDATVLLLGESGVGKEVVARMIHEASPRAETGTFVKINCGAIPGELLESELFGYEAGAFSGASKEGKPGYFVIADRGTLFLDEIGDMPVPLQVKLLSVIQDQEVTRLGGTKPTKVDVRIVAATNRDLEERVRTGLFREDLFYRLNVVPLQLPPLRDRKEDIPFLLLHFLGKYNRKYGLDHRLSSEVVERLSSFRWPGNVRELANLVEHLVVLSDEKTIRPEHLPAKYLPGSPDRPEERAELLPLREELERHEQMVINRIVAGSRTLEEAAHRLGVSLSTLARRLRKGRGDSQL